MQTHRAAKLYACIRTLILFLFAYYISDLVRTTHIEYYLAPSMVRYEKWAVIVLFIVALVQLYATLSLFFGESKPASCECGHDHDHSETSFSLKQVLVFAVFLLPLAAGFLMPDTELGSAIVAQKGISLAGDNVLLGVSYGETSAKTPIDASISEKESGETIIEEKDLQRMFPIRLMEVFSKFGIMLYQQPVIEVRDGRYMETLATLNLYLDNYVGKEIQISGSVFRLGTLDKNKFVLGRLGVSCCAADANPVGVVVEDANANEYANDEWLTIKGTISKTTYKNQNVLMIKTTNITRISMPTKGFYVYRDSGFYINQ
ncbi:TIGR03943 family protein [Paenibacillus sp. SI8]|uniref:TIGR03943 family putative permease subunit n=1 Tax=unclassified Paenibacillus TaxID=185978 RepID=UPI003467DBF8